MIRSWSKQCKLSHSAITTSLAERHQAGRTPRGAAALDDQGICAMRTVVGTFPPMVFKIGSRSFPEPEYFVQPSMFTSSER